MSVVMMFKCPKCEKIFEADNVYKEHVVETQEDGTEIVKEYPINYVKLAYYDYKQKQIVHEAYGKDICPDCMREIAAAILAGENTKIRIHEVKPKERKRPGYTHLLKNRENKSEVEQAQAEFAAQKAEDDDDRE